MKIILVTPLRVEHAMCKHSLTLKKAGKLRNCALAVCKLKEDEVYAVQSGPGKGRAVIATMAAIDNLAPDMVIDTGSCAGIEPKTAIGQIIIGGECFEYDISGKAISRKLNKKMILPSAFSFLKDKQNEILLDSAVSYGKAAGFTASEGSQASGEYIVNSTAMRSGLFGLFKATGCNWETAGVYVSALRSALPVLSIRVVTDLGDENALKDFFMNIKTCTRELYKYIYLLFSRGWFRQFLMEWQKIKKSVRQRIPENVLP
jgi:adenosylhomocysteine nucleosidase